MARHQLYIETAIDLLVREKPQLVDLTAEERPNAGTYRVKDVEGYLDAIVNNIRRQGACAERDPDSLQYTRILVKDSSDFSEGFYLISPKGFIQRGRDALAESCEPASFPVDRSGDVPPAGSGCGKPYPPPIHHFNSKIHTPGIDAVTLDSTAIVGPDVVYCATIGYTDGRAWCPVRVENDPEREPCEAWRVGTRQGYRPLRADLDVPGPLLHRSRERLHEPPREPARPVRARGRRLRDVRSERGVRRAGGRLLTRRWRRAPPLSGRRP